MPEWIEPRSQANAHILCAEFERIAHALPLRGLCLGIRVVEAPDVGCTHDAQAARARERLAEGVIRCPDRIFDDRVLARCGGRIGECLGHEVDEVVAQVEATCRARESTDHRVGDESVVEADVIDLAGHRARTCGVGRRVVRDEQRLGVRAELPVSGNLLGVEQLAILPCVLGLGACVVSERQVRPLADRHRHAVWPPAIATVLSARVEGDGAVAPFLEHDVKPCGGSCRGALADERAPVVVAIHVGVRVQVDPERDGHAAVVERGAVGGAEVIVDPVEVDRLVCREAADAIGVRCAVEDRAVVAIRGRVLRVAVKAPVTDEICGLLTHEQRAHRVDVTISVVR